MISYVVYNELDKEKWNNCIARSVNGQVYAFSWYLDSTCEHWDALVEDDYRAVMPLPSRKKLGFFYIFPPTLTQQLGVFSDKEISASEVAAFIHAIPAKFKYVETLINYGNPHEKLKTAKKTHINLELDLGKPYSEIHKAYSENLRRNLKKISESYFSIKREDTLENLITIFKNNREAKIGTLPRDFYDVLRKIALASGGQDCGELWNIYSSGELQAGIFFVKGCGRAVFLFSASTDDAKKHHAMPYLIDFFIRAYAGSPLILDFEGSDNPNLARFYRSFGATERNYLKIEFSAFPDLIIKIIKYLLKIKNKLL
ncbi:MAG TPA: GNAT family N-acetyltransferase [Bacteroidales bacterium]|nr:GNAT family N-acetyltransferase [Bacteroidales bacterium]